MNAVQGTGELMITAEVARAFGVSADATIAWPLPRGQFKPAGRR